MENKTKMFICIGLIILMGIIYQVVYEDQASLLIGGILLFSIGFGWYACKAKSEDLRTKK